MDKTTNGKKIAEYFIKSCIESGIPVLEAYLFGSWAKGSAMDFSDIDVAIVSDSFGKNIIENTKQTALINYNFPDVEVHHFSRSEFKSGDPFINEIKRTGIKIYG
jgi:uncharacterized protein